MKLGPHVVWNGIRDGKRYMGTVIPIDSGQFMGAVLEVPRPGFTGETVDGDSRTFSTQNDALEWVKEQQLRWFE